LAVYDLKFTKLSLLLQSNGAEKTKNAVFLALEMGNLQLKSLLS
jgi:hypothetical protein